MSEQKQSKLKDYITYEVAAWVVSVILIAMGFLFTSVTANGSKVDRVIDNYGDVNMQLSQIQTDVQWIKDTLQDNK